VWHDSHIIQVFVEASGFLWIKKRGRRCAPATISLFGTGVWGVKTMIAIIAGALFFAGLLIGGCIAWFIRSVIADVAREDKVIDRRVRAQQQLTGRA
jgi:hypothetical protein